MSRTYRTARGKTLDIDKIKLANEDTLSVGNMKINARGDKIGQGGQVEAGRNAVMDKVYTVPIGGYSPTNPEFFNERTIKEENSRAKELHDLANSLVQSSENTEAVERNEARSPRGSLASSVAPMTTVKQEPMPDPRKSKGPTRI